jgi:hypothetical protein
MQKTSRLLGVEMQNATLRRRTAVLGSVLAGTLLLLGTTGDLAAQQRGGTLIAAFSADPAGSIRCAARAACPMS